MSGTDANDREAARGATESDFPCCEVVGEGSGAQKAREARYAEAVRDVQIANGGRIRYTELIARAVVAVADAELAELKAEVERLTRWKSEATEVILGLQDLGRALELPLGERITGEAAAEAARTLKAEVERLRAAVTRVGEADQRTIHMYSDAMVKWKARAESAEAALVSEREAHAGLRARLEALADDLAGALAVALYDAHPIYANTAGWRGGIGGQAITQGCSMIDPPPQQEWLEAGLDLLSTPLRAWIQERPAFDLAAAKARVEARARAVLTPIAPVAAEEGDERVAGEVTNGPLPECEHGVPRHYGCAQCIAAGITALANGGLDPAPSGSDEQGNRPATSDANGVHDTKGGEGR